MQRRIPELDGLRGIAVLMVASIHAAGGIFRGGWLGVDVFFVLSGYLITSILLSEYQRSCTIDFKAFYFRRALRLLPALVLLLVVHLVIALALLKTPAIPTIAGAAAVLFYVANFASIFHWPVNLDGINQAWSLAIEEQFYLLWPLCLIWLLRRCSIKRILLILVIGFLIIGFYRATIYNLTGAFTWCYTGFDMRADALLAGCIVALLPQFSAPQNLRKCTFLLPTVGGILFVKLGYEQAAQWSLSVVELSIAAGLLYLLHSPDSLAVRLLRITPLVWLGQASYGIYLWHSFVVHIPLPSAAWNIRLRAPFELALAILIASLSYHLIEKPFLKFKDRLRNRTEKELLTASHAGFADQGQSHLTEPAIGG